MSIPFPNIDPVAFGFEIAGRSFDIHWYALAYVAGFLLGWRVAIYLVKLYRDNLRPNTNDIDDFITWAILGVLFGGRLGYVLFYNLPTYLDAPFEALKVWHGGMSFHGGALGVILALILFAKIKHVSFKRLADIATTVVPIGLFFGRVANFVNGELYGRVTDSSLGVIFPRGGDLPRHPSQLYEAVFEGIVLFGILFALMHIKQVRSRYGVIAGAFLTLYGVFRFGIEFFREPDVQLGFFFDQVTMGQILCVPMMLVGTVVMVWCFRCKTLAK
ncbi:MAG: prolipoprotein diacylglyceryl transferase [Alphaproteobacteria bacterium]|nr:prolipoprotein diacylglyceryl transferase [Alphaproteobacteria bacterium]MCB1551845.1 prolipoprotein diacylglyceryl transferase [Alphaproteobacteria bacterium]MCB9984430.1 prolipoprotein diacylglyceryl transferase [Micavibrio sp.]HPQ50848.1 prolipoprotein diacylglyceryl transferase [Alphaproteobacteria bacterium]HRK97805.1 prolipoprotein diacylglyceryl transferase [Alphaproteobacteria bacterium]